jgi:hypothetical protein
MSDPDNITIPFGACEFGYKPKKSPQDRATELVTWWLAQCWISRPVWMNRMPDKAHVQTLVNRIAKELR